MDAAEDGVRDWWSKLPVPKVNYQSVYLLPKVVNIEALYQSNLNNNGSYLFFFIIMAAKKNEFVIPVSYINYHIIKSWPHTKQTKWEVAHKKLPMVTAKGKI